MLTVLRRLPWVGSALAMGALFAASAASCATSCGGSGAEARPALPGLVAARAMPGPNAFVLVGAGDIGACTPASMRTGDLVEHILAASPNARAFTAGDNAYPVGSLANYQTCYEPAWGAFKGRTLAAAGNHDWMTSGAAGFRATFGLRSDAPTYRSTNVGPWHVILLDTNCEDVGGCDPSSPQGTWLARDLALAAARCQLAIFHHPLFSSGAHHTSDPRAAPLWQILDDANVELIVSGHEHIYERYIPLGADGRAREGDGIQSVVVGTGGAVPYPLAAARVAGSKVALEGRHGVLVLHLEETMATGYFVDLTGTIADEFTVECR